MGPFVPNQWTLTQGDDCQIMVHCLDTTGIPLNLSGASAVELLLKNQDGSTTTLTATQGMASSLSCPLWVYVFAITGAQTMNLPIGVNQTTVLKVNWGSESQKFSLLKSLTVVAPAI